MNFRIFEIIKLIESRVSENALPVVSEEIFEELVLEGYKNEEIEEAITWIEVYQNNSFSENLFEISDDFISIDITDTAYDYLSELKRKKLVSKEYVDILLDYCLINSSKTLTIESLKMFEEMMNFAKGDLSYEAMANYKAYNLRKDC